MPKRKRGDRQLSDYRYGPLRSGFRQIRLIRLQPSPALRDVVKCEIDTFEVNTAPDYEALSYVWGNASDVTHIKVGSRHRMRITRSLDSALRYLRHRDKERLLWADAISINQGKIAEKNETVAQMHVIYQNAQQVIVWLGQPVRPWSFRVIVDMPDEEDDKAYFRGPCQLENRLNSNARALLQFGKLPWFSRGWVVQEVCFARRIQIRFGRHLLAWEQFQKVAAKLASVLPPFLKFVALHEQRAFIAIQESISSLIEARLQLRKEQAMSLCSLLPFARTKRTTDPRDKIFAFMTLLPVVPESLQVDYSKETKIVFTRVAQLLLKEDVGLRLLAECELNSISCSGVASACLPSWVPDWAQSRACGSLLGGLSTRLQGHEYTAGNHLPASTFEILGDNLLLQALIWDNIIFLDPLASVKGATPELRKPLLAHFGMDSRRYTENFPQVPLSHIKFDCCKDFARLCRRVGMCNRDPKGLKILDIDDFPYSDWAADEHQAILARSLMLTSEHYVGWAPPAAAIGDVISIIPGCHVPIVLRKAHDRSFTRKDSAALLDTEATQRQDLEEEIPLFTVIGEACKYI